MRNTIKILILILISTQIFAQKNKGERRIKREYKSVYIGTYTKDTIILENLLEPPKVNHYDVDGNILSSTSFIEKKEGRNWEFSEESNSELFDLEKMDTFFYWSYQYENGLLMSRVYWDNKKNIQTYNSYYTYDKSGKCIAKTDCKSPNCNSGWKYAYNKKGDIKSEILTENGIITKKNKIFNKYKKRNLISREIHKSDEGELVSIEKYEKGKLISVHELIQGWKTTYTYYESGEEKTWTKDFGDSRTVMYTWFERDEHGNPMVKTWIGEDGYGEITIINYEYYL